MSLIVPLSVFSHMLMSNVSIWKSYLTNYKHSDTRVFNAFLRSLLPSFRLNLFSQDWESQYCLNSSTSTRHMATSVQGEVLCSWGHPWCLTSTMFCGSKSCGQVILEGKALGNNTLSRTSRGRLGAGRGVLSHLVVYWSCLLELSLQMVTLSRRSGSARGFFGWRPVKMLHGLKGGLGRVFLSSLMPSGCCSSQWAFACFDSQLLWSAKKHLVWYLLTCPLREKSFRRATPFFFAHSATFSSVSV